MKQRQDGKTSDRKLTPIDLLVASGRASRPVGDLLQLGPPPIRLRRKSLSRALLKQRAKRF
jgi:hypothetical protein